MASGTGAVWAIDIGNNSLKALRLSDVGGVVEVIGFDNIRHGKILSGTGVTAAERDELIASSLRQFAGRNDLGKDEIIVSVPSQNSFARFVNLPPVEPKRIPEIVKFEAAQQIPFDINDVQWDWQLMGESDSGEKRVGIFAIKNDIVALELEHFGRENIQVGYVQMAPMALYNYLVYDRPDLTGSDSKAVIVLNVGAENTDLVVCTKSTVWQRSIPMGGNAFTRAIEEAFKLNFEKAEKLKRTAAMSKYARQILQAMKPVFTDLASEIQRSLGFYSNSNPNTKLSRVVALGGGTKMRGLLKYLQQSLQMPVGRPDSFKKLAISADVSAAKFHESVCDFGIVYGLALQGLGLGRIESNLLPRRIARSMAWAGKAKYFTAAACMLLLVSVLCLARTNLDRIGYARNKSQRQKIKTVIDTARQASSKLKAQEGRGTAYEAIIKKEFDLFKYRDVVPLLYQTMISTLPSENNNPEQKELYRAFTESNVEAILGTARKERKQIFVTGMSVSFADDVSTVNFGKTDFRKRSRIKRRKGEGAGFTEEEFLKAEMEMMGVSVGQKPKFARPSFEKDKKADAKKEEGIEGGAGFIVTIEGFSPYKDIGKLLDPAGVGNDKGKWGVVTRLMHLDDIIDGNVPFELYGKTDPKHFKLQKGEVAFDVPMPDGIGIEFEEETRKGGRSQSTERFLIDPMTKEIISKVAELDKDRKKKVDRSGKDVYRVNDHWFRLDLKFIWKDVPKVFEESR